MQLAGIPWRALCVLIALLAPASAWAAVKYQPKITGVFDRKLLGDLRTLSQLVQLEDKPPTRWLASVSEPKPISSG